MREKGKTPENQLSNEEILSLQEKDFRLLMLKMMQDIGNKLEAKMDNLQETLTKEIQDIKLKQEEMQNTITEIKKTATATTTAAAATTTIINVIPTTNTTIRFLHPQLAH